MGGWNQTEDGYCQMFTFKLQHYDHTSSLLDDFSDIFLSLLDRSFWKEKKNS